MRKAPNENEFRTVEKIMSKKLLLVLAALLAVALIGCGKTPKKPEQGKSVEIHLKLEVPDDASPEKRKDIEDNFARYRDETIGIIRKRLEARKMPCVRIAPEGERGIVVRTAIPEEKDEQKLKNLFIGARLEFRLVHRDSEALVAQYLAEFRSANKDGDDTGRLKEQAYLQSKAPAGYELMSALETYKNKSELRYYYVSKEIEMDGRNIKEAYPDKDQWGLKINLSFNAKGAEDFARVTRRNVGRQLAIVLDGRLYCAPNIREAITGGRAQISGSFTEDEAETIAYALTGGGLPLKVTVENVEKR